MASAAIGLSMEWNVVYKITWPNGQAYIGSDLADTISYVGSPDPALIVRDFTREERRNLTIHRETLWESCDAADQEVRAKEIELIREHGTNNLAKGYNRRPAPRLTDSVEI